MDFFWLFSSFKCEQFHKASLLVPQLQPLVEASIRFADLEGKEIDRHIEIRIFKFISREIPSMDP